jgi:acetoin:2,6-dichlorophenolindophenol oxidoreductase subunit alpha
MRRATARWYLECPVREVSQAAPNWKQPSERTLREMLRRMLRIRLFDETATKVQTTSVPGMLHNTTGQEGEVVGACMALRDDDYITGSHRSHGHPIAKGVPLAPLMAELLGRKTGVCRGKGGSMHLAAFGAGSLGESGVVGASMPTATGAALSAVLRKSGQVCLCFFGDGAANCGLFHESLNLASIWRLPVIFFCENNGYAVSSNQTETTAVRDIATRAASYGIPGCVVDGQDVLAVHDAVATAVDRARHGDGPTLLEAKTYRFCDHLEGAAFPVYRSEEELALWKKRDPIELFIAKLRDGDELSLEEVANIRAEVESEAAAALKFAEESPMPAAEELLQDVFV